MIKRLLILLFCLLPVFVYADNEVSVGGQTADGHIIQDEGINLRQRSKLNFVGSGVTASNVGSASTINIPGGIPYTGATSDLDLGAYNITASYFYGDGSHLTGTPAASVTWGAVTGTLSNQTDLQEALDLKANLAGANFTADTGVGTGVKLYTNNEKTSYQTTDVSSGWIRFYHNNAEVMRFEN